METTHQLSLRLESPAILTLLAVVLLAVGLAGWGWWRSGFDRGTGGLELVRVLLVTLAAGLLLQPEWKQTTVSREGPAVALLWDRSDSMQTADVVTTPGDVHSRTARADWLTDCLQDSLWEQWSDEVQWMRLPFAGTTGGRDGTDMDEALRGVLSVARLRAVVLLSDGDWNMGASPLAAARQLRARGVPVLAVGVGDELPLPDVEIVALEPPTYAVVGKTLQIPFVLRSSLTTDYPVTVTLTREGGEVLSKQVTVPAQGDVRDAFFWTPAALGPTTWTLDVPAHAQETFSDNNRRAAEVMVREEGLKVLVVESVPRWEYRYLRNALQRDPGVDVACVLFHPDLMQLATGDGYLDAFPATRAALADYDVVILGDVGVQPGQLTTADCTLLKGLVQQQASGLVLIPGRSGRQFSLLDTELRDLYPAVLDPQQPRGTGDPFPSHFLLTEAGRRSLLTKLADREDENAAIWQALPGFHWRAPITRATAGSTVLAVDEQTRTPLLITKPYGTGKVLLLGTDTAWRWREGVEDLYHYRFWGQVARWMAYQRHLAKGDKLRLFYTPERPRPGNTVTLNAVVLGPDGGLLPDATLHAEIVAPDDQRQSVGFQATGDDWGVYAAKFQPHVVGDYNVTLRCQETAAELTTTVAVRGTTREAIGKPANFAVLQEIAQVTRGHWYPHEQWRNLGENLGTLPPPEPQVRTVPLWAHPAVATILIAGLTLFWIGRKLKGTV